MVNSSLAQRAVFLDRDGIINSALVKDGKPYSPRTLAELEILPGVPGALESLRQARFKLIVVTNQPDVARGKQSREAVEQLHQKLKESDLAIDAFYVCYHDTADLCDCRKPRPGMLLAAARDLHLDLRHSFMVGDRWRDIEAGQHAGCASIFVDYHYAEPRPQPPFVTVGSTAEAAQFILSCP